MLLVILLALSGYFAWESYQSLEREEQQIAEAYDAFQYTINTQKNRNIRLNAKMKRNLTDLFVKDSIYTPAVEQFTKYVDDLEIVLDSQMDVELYDHEKLIASIEQFCDQISLIINEKSKLDSFRQNLLFRISASDDPQDQLANLLESKIALYGFQNHLLSTLEDRIIAEVPEYETIWSGY
ncbi:MAG: hypothetical protein AAFQ94_18225 [Bacteroidota bacterium]